MIEMSVVAWLRRAAVTGVIGGVVLVYLSLVGLVGAFADRDVITNVVTLGQVMLSAVTFLIGYRVAVAPRGVQPPAMGVRLAGGILAGAIAGAALGLLIMLGYSPIDLQSVFIRLSPDLLEFLAFGQPAPVGAVMQIGLNALIGLLGAGLLLLPSRLRGPIIAGLLGVALASMVEPYLRPRLQQVGLDDLVDLLYRQHGLTIAAAIVIFVGVAAIAVIWDPTRHRINRRMAACSPSGGAPFDSRPRDHRPVRAAAAADHRPVHAARCWCWSGSISCWPGPEHRGRLRRPARPGLRGVLRGRRLPDGDPDLA